MNSFCLVLSRFCLAAWVGAAAFFFIVLFDLRASQLFDKPTLNNHAKVLFPAYYAFELTIAGTALATALAAAKHPTRRRGPFAWQFGLMLAATVLGIADYAVIYLPLSAMLDLPALPREFRMYHGASMAINSLSLVLWLAASLISLWPAATEMAAN